MTFHTMKLKIERDIHMTEIRRAPSKIKTTIMAIICCLLWGSAMPVLKICYREMNITGSNIGENLTLIGMRFLLAGALLFLISLALKMPLFKITFKDIKAIIILGLCSTTFQYFFFNIGLANTPGVKAIVIEQTSIFFSIVLAHFIYKDDKINKQKSTGLILGLVGLIIVNLNKDTGNIFAFKIMGEGFMLMAGLNGALSMIIAKKIGSKLPTLVMTTWQMLIGSAILFVIGLGMGGRPSTLEFSPLSTVLFFYTAVLSASAFGLWFYILQYRKVGDLSIYKFIIPVSGSVMSAMFVPEEPILFVHVIGLFLVTMGIIIVNRQGNNNMQTVQE